MFEIISSAENTQWHTFPEFSTKYSYSHVANEKVDFELVSDRNYFLEINKKCGFELLRTCKKNHVEIIQRVKKRQLDDLQCATVSRVYGSEVALGLSTGFVRLFSLKSGNFLPIKLKPNEIGNSVSALSFSCLDEHLAILYESGDISIFGMKTSVKTDTFRFDGTPTIIRFHPTKRFALATGLNEGAVIMYDIQTKKKLLYNKDAHAAPVRDIAMCSASPEVFLSCSFDCNVNVYDLRKRTIVQQTKHSKPLSTAAFSPCGNYCVAGNLKGDLIAYDFRNLKVELDSKRAHNSAVIRVAFIPPVDDTNATDHFGESIQSNVSSIVTPLAAPAIKTGSNNDSFNKFIEAFKAKDVDDIASPAKNRDSLCDFIGTQNFHDFSTESVISSAMSPSRLSLGGGLDTSELRLKKMTPRIAVSNALFTENTSKPKPEPSNQRVHEEPNVKLLHPPAAKRSRRTESAELPEIEEEDKIDEEIDNEFELNNIDGAASHNKENLQNNQQDIETFAKFIKTTHVSTPNTVQVKSQKSETEHIDLNALSELMDSKLNIFTERLNETKAEILRRVNECENELKFYQDQYYHKSFLANFNMYRSNQRETDTIKEGITMMLHCDEFVDEFHRLQQENNELRAKLNLSN